MMSCECDHTLCCDVLTASESATTTVHELYRRPSRRRHPRHGGRSRLLLQHVSCPSTFPKSRDEQTTSSADELGAWASRRTRSEVPPLAGPRRHKVTRPGKRASRPYVLPLGRRGSRLHRTTTIVHHPCCLYDPSLCPVIRSTQRRQKIRVEDVDSDAFRTTEELRNHIESILRDHQHRHTQEPPASTQASCKHTSSVQPKQTSEKPTTQEKRCEICGSSEPVPRATAEDLGQSSRPTVASQVEADMLTGAMSSDTADRLLDELHRRSAGATRSTAGNNVGLRGGPSPAAHLPAAFGPHREDTHRFPITVQVAPRRLSAVNHGHPMTEMQHIYVQPRKIPTQRNMPNAPLAPHHLSHPNTIGQGPAKEMWRSPKNLLEAHSSCQEPEVTLTKSDEATSYTMQSITAARAAVKSTIMSPNDGMWHQQASGNFSHRGLGDNIKPPLNIQQESIPSFNKGVAQADKGMAPSARARRPPTASVSPAPSHNVSTFDGCNVPEVDVLVQSDPNSARLTNGTYISDISGQQQIRHDTGHFGTSSSHGPSTGRRLQSGGQSPACSGSQQSYVDGEARDLDSWRSTEAKVKQGPDTGNILSNDMRSDTITVVNGADEQFVLISNHSSPLLRKTSVQRIPLGIERNDSNEMPMKEGKNFSCDSDRTGSENGSMHSKNTFSKPVSKTDEVVDTSFCSDDIACGSYRSKSDNLRKSSRADGENVEERAKGISENKNETHSLASSLRSWCREGQNIEANELFTSCPTTLCCSSSSSRRNSLRHAAIRERANRVEGSREDEDRMCATRSCSQGSLADQIEASRIKITESIDKALSIIANSVNGSSTRQKMEEKDAKLRVERRTPPLESVDAADLVPTRDCSPGKLASQLWHHVDSAIRDTLVPVTQHQDAGAAAATSVEGRKNKKLLLKLRRDLTKNILMNLKHLDNIESSLYSFDKDTPPASK